MSLYGLSQKAVAHLCHGQAKEGRSSRIQADRRVTQILRTIAKPRYPW